MESTTHKYKAELIETAKAIVRPGRGILAADESTGTIGSRFKGIDVENNEENRRAYRSLLFESEGIENYISGVIMFEETLGHATQDGKNLVELLRSKGIYAGIKVDKGVVPIMGTNGETATQGLDGLGARCAKYYEQGCRFAKWRAVLKIDTKTGCPSNLSIQETAHSLARYGSICQDNGLVPIIEPEILIDGDHSIETSAEVSERVFSAVMKAMIDHKLILEGTLIKPNMVTPGASSTETKTAQEIAWYTVRTLSRTFVGAIPGIVFLSGGQSEEQASLNLSEMNKITAINRPWRLSFSYGRALQQSCLKAWLGKPENTKAAQDALLERAKANSEATEGKYTGGSGATESTYVANYTY